MNISEIKVSYSNKSKELQIITDSKSSYTILLACWNKHTIELQEEFKVLLLNRRNAVLGIYSLSKGGVSGTIVDVKLVFSVALKCNASHIIIAHNHPSGNLKASAADKSLTNKIKTGAELLDIKLLDHIIITKDDYYSFADNCEL
jgi:DNA repair protein RadC